MIVGTEILPSIPRALIPAQATQHPVGRPVWVWETHPLRGLSGGCCRTARFLRGRLMLRLWLYKETLTAQKTDQGSKQSTLPALAAEDVAR